jgi:2-phospho-L-lactate/phosphoenolpyruvate guanylyltransferase
MRTAAVLPVKKFANAKQRLASALGAGSRQALAQAMFMDVLAALRHVNGLEQIVIVASEPNVDFAADHQVVVLEDELQEGQTAAALMGIGWALAAGFERVLLVPGDTPLLAVEEVQALLEGAGSTPVVIVPDRHQAGTNALLLRPPDVIEPSFGPDSLARHIAAAGEARVEHRVERVPSLVFDVDTADDLAVVAAAIEERHAVAPRTRGALRQLDRAGARLRQHAGAGN